MSGITTSDAPLPGSVLVMQPDHSYADDVYGHLDELTTEVSSDS